MRIIRVAIPNDVDDIAEAVQLLRQARDLLREAGASRAVVRVRDALASPEGAERHVRHRLKRSSARTGG